MAPGLAGKPATPLPEGDTARAPPTITALNGERPQITANSIIVPVQQTVEPHGTQTPTSAAGAGSRSSCSRWVERLLDRIRKILYCNSYSMPLRCPTSTHTCSSHSRRCAIAATAQATNASHGPISCRSFLPSDSSAPNARHAAQRWRCAMSVRPDAQPGCARSAPCGSRCNPASSEDG